MILLQCILALIGMFFSPLWRTNLLYRMKKLKRLCVLQLDSYDEFVLITVLCHIFQLQSKNRWEAKAAVLSRKKSSAEEDDDEKGVSASSLSIYG